jgi:LysM repeat protein
LIRAEKRKQLMNATPEHNSVGHFKRRSSEDGPSASAPPEHGHDRDALVYVHHVRPEDTLAGITIKYNIHPSALRRANRMWPNDRIQVRKTILLPDSGKQSLPYFHRRDQDTRSYGQKEDRIRVHEWRPPFIIFVSLFTRSGSNLGT